MNIASLFIRIASSRSAKRFEAAVANPVQAQADLLLRILKNNADTEYGKQYGFSSIRSAREYRESVPVVSYADIQAHVERMVHGEENILTAQKPVMFAQTSGTTGDPKYIPVTPACQGRYHADVMRTWLWHASNAHPGVFGGKIASLVSPAVEGMTPAGIPYGSTSGSMYRSIPWIVQRAYSVPYCAFEIADYQAKYYAIMRTAIAQNVTFLCTANPSSILKLCEKGNEFSEDILRDIRDGTLSDRYPFEPRQRAALEATYRPNPELAKRLEALRSRREGVLKPADYWPNLALIGCWKGGTVGHHLKRFDAWFRREGAPSVPVRDWGYLASEMRGSVPLSDEGCAGVLTVAANFYEFSPVEDVANHPDDPGRWNFLGADEIEDGKEYYIFVTTTGGLYRYDINDIVRVEGFYRKTPQIVFLRKGRGMTNITGEKLSVNQVIEAVTAAGQAGGADVRHFKAEADLGSARYVLRVEFGSPPSPDGQKQFLRAFEDSLQRLNLEYKSKRDSQRLGAPVLHIMREGWYERKRKDLVLGGGRMFQAKTELLSPIKVATHAIQHELQDVVTLEGEDKGGRNSDDTQQEQ